MGEHGVGQPERQKLGIRANFYHTLGQLSDDDDRRPVRSGRLHSQTGQRRELGRAHDQAEAPRRPRERILGEIRRARDELAPGQQDAPGRTRIVARPAQQLDIAQLVLILAAAEQAQAGGRRLQRQALAPDARPKRGLAEDRIERRQAGAGQKRRVKRLRRLRFWPRPGGHGTDGQGGEARGGARRSMP